jgi:hypothetical protein
VPRLGRLEGSGGEGVEVCDLIDLLCWFGIAFLATRIALIVTDRPELH